MVNCHFVLIPTFMHKLVLSHPWVSFCRFVGHCISCVCFHKNEKMSLWLPVCLNEKKLNKIFIVHALWTSKSWHECNTMHGSRIYFVTEAQIVDFLVDLNAKILILVNSLPHLQRLKYHQNSNVTLSLSLSSYYKYQFSKEGVNKNMEKGN